MFVYLLTLLETEKMTFYLDLKDVKYIFTEELTKKESFIGFILNSLIEDWEDEFLLFFGVKVTPEEFSTLLDMLKTLVPIGEEKNVQEYTLLCRQ